MSNASWMEEFYPVDAFSVRVEDALTHSIQKWKGYTKESLDRHDISVAPVLASSGSCALCNHFHATSEIMCDGCPLYNERGLPCYISSIYETYSPYHAYTVDGDTTPMLLLMERCK